MRVIMSKRFQHVLIAVAALALLAGCAQEQRRPSETRVLPNGLTIIAKENRSSDVVSLQAWIRDGALFETPDEAGRAALLSRMVFEQTTSRGQGEIPRAIEGVGGWMSTRPFHDFVYFAVVVPSEHFDLALDLLSDGLLNPVFSSERFEKTKTSVAREIRGIHDRPIDYAHRLCLKHMMGEHPYGRHALGIVEALDSLTLEQVEQHHRDAYVGSNIVIVVAGSLDPGAAAERVEAAFSGLEAGTPSGEEAAPVEWPSEPQRVTVRGDLRKAYQVVAFPAPSVQDPENVVMDVLLMIIGRGRSSRLNRVLNEELGLVGSVDAGWATARQPSPMLTWMELAPENVRAAERAVVDVFVGLGTEDVSEEELAKAKTLLETEILFGKETCDGQAAYHGYWAAVYGVTFADEYLRKMADVTAEDVRNAAAKYFQPERYAVAAVLPEWAK
jgi:zinc protease